MFFISVGTSFTSCPHNVPLIEWSYICSKTLPYTTSFEDLGQYSINNQVQVKQYFYGALESALPVSISDHGGKCRSDLSEANVVNSTQETTNSCSNNLFGPRLWRIITKGLATIACRKPDCSTCFLLLYLHTDSATPYAHMYN